MLGVNGADTGTSAVVNIGTANGSSGNLTIQNGSTLTSSGHVRLGEVAGSTGKAAVTGAGSTWTINSTAALIVGNAGTGRLTISKGGSVSAPTGYTIVGDKSSGTGTLKVESGGTLTTGTNAFIGGQNATATGKGTVTVTGTSSLWSIDGDLTIGNGGTGKLTIEDRGKVTATGDTTVANVAGSMGTLNINSGGTLETVSLTGGPGTAQANFDGGTLRATAQPTGDFITGFSDGELNIKKGGLTLDDGGFILDIDSPLSGSGGLTKTGSGTVLLNENNTFAGGLTVEEGTAQAGIAGTAFGTGLMASLEAGYPIALGYGLTLEPQAQAIYQHLAFDRANDPFSTVDFDTPDAVVGRLGVRLSGAFGTWRPYLKVNLWHDWLDEDKAIYAATHVAESEHASTALELGGGVVANLGPRWGLWADADYTQDIDGEEREAVRGTAGLRLRW